MSNLSKGVAALPHTCECLTWTAERPSVPGLYLLAIGLDEPVVYRWSMNHSQTWWDKYCKRLGPLPEVPE